MTASRSAVGWRCRPSGGGWPSISAVAPTISPASTSGPSCTTCSKAFLGKHPRLHVHYFPAYAPELNPAEYVWAQGDKALANGAPDDLAELRQSLDSAIRRLRRSQRRLWSCIYASDLAWAR